MEPTCVRVPVLVGHAVSATLRFERPVTADEAVEVLGAAPRGSRSGPTRSPPRSTLRGSTTCWRVGSGAPWVEPGGINLWVVGDNLRKGAALNAVQIAELLLS